MKNNFDLRPRCFIIRGLPGSGKSTLAAKYHAKGLLHIDEDMFAIRGGVYHWNDPKDNTADTVGAKFQGVANPAVWCDTDMVLTGVFPVFEQDATMDIFHALSLRKYKVWIATLDGRYGNIHRCPEGRFANFQPHDGFLAKASAFSDRFQIVSGVMPSEVEISETTGAVE